MTDSLADAIEVLVRRADVLRALSAAHQEQTLRSDAVDLSGMADGHAALVVSRATDEERR